jgi:hypothetical protein
MGNGGIAPPFLISALDGGEWYLLSTEYSDKFFAFFFSFTRHTHGGRRAQTSTACFQVFFFLLLMKNLPKRIYMEILGFRALSNISVCYTPSSEPYRIYMVLQLTTANGNQKLKFWQHTSHVGASAH